MLSRVEPPLANSTQSEKQPTYLTGGSVDGSGLFKHVGWPKPPLLIPVPPEGFGVMSNTILSGRFGSPDTPPTWPKPSSANEFRMRQAFSEVRGQCRLHWRAGGCVRPRRCGLRALSAGAALSRLRRPVPASKGLVNFLSVPILLFITVSA